MLVGPHHTVALCTGAPAADGTVPLVLTHDRTTVETLGRVLLQRVSARP